MYVKQEALSKRKTNVELKESNDREKTHNFLLGAQHTKLAKANVKGGTLERSIRLSYNYNIDASGESGRVKATVQLLHCHKHSLRQLAHDIHGLRLETKSTLRPSEMKQKESVCIKYFP